MSMSGEALKVLEMLAAGKITVEEADQLLAALGEARPLVAENQGGRAEQAEHRDRREERASAFFANLDPDQLGALRAAGVDAAYIRDMVAAGLTDLDADELIAMKSVGIDPAYAAEMRDLGIADLDELTSLKAVGVDAAFVQAMREAGFTDLDVDQLVTMKATGVDPAYVREMRGVRPR